jgi:hypothetical protein
MFALSASSVTYRGFNTSEPCGFINVLIVIPPILRKY